jgi:phosphoenolpyruvate synthase/pyruvate phosphate dikinase
MIPKGELLERLDNAIELEEKGVALIARVIKGKVEKTPMPKRAKSRLVDILNIIEEDSRAHEKAFKAMSDAVRRDVRDVF